MKIIGIDVFGKDVLQATLDYLENAKRHYATPDGITKCQEWIKSLVEEPANDDLEEKVLNVWEDEPHNKWPKCPYQDFKNIALHFANWQKEQMIKKSVDGEVIEVLDDGCSICGHTHLELFFESWTLLENFKNGDKVKVIIVKED